jgi:hypothetical protein
LPGHQLKVMALTVEVLVRARKYLQTGISDQNPFEEGRSISEVIHSTVSFLMTSLNETDYCGDSTGTCQTDSLVHILLALNAVGNEGITSTEQQSSLHTAIQFGTERLTKLLTNESDPYILSIASYLLHQIGHPLAERFWGILMSSSRKFESSNYIYWDSEKNIKESNEITSYALLTSLIRDDTDDRKLSINSYKMAAWLLSQHRTTQGSIYGRFNLVTYNNALPSFCATARKQFGKSDRRNITFTSSHNSTESGAYKNILGSKYNFVFFRLFPATEYSIFGEGAGLNLVQMECEVVETPENSSSAGLNLTVTSVRPALTNHTDYVFLNNSPLLLFPFYLIFRPSAYLLIL